MFSGKNKRQYILIKKSDKQLKIDTQILVNSRVSKVENSSYLMGNKLPADAKKKIKALKKKVSNSYTILLCEGEKQSIVFDSAEASINNSSEIRTLNDTCQVAVNHKIIQQYNDRYSSVGINYLFSPFQILHKHIIINKADTNSLNILILNNIIYAFILDESLDIVHSSTKFLTPYDKASQNLFKKDDVEEQKQYDDMHFKELKDAINSITSEFYKKTSQKELFCQNVSICYTIKQLNDEQLVKLKDDLMLDVKYSSININDYMLYFVKRTNVSKFSFMLPPTRKVQKKPFPWFLILIVSAVIFGTYLYKQKTSIAESLWRKNGKFGAKQADNLEFVKQHKNKLKKVKIHTPKFEPYVPKAYNEDELTDVLKNINNIKPAPRIYDNTPQETKHKSVPKTYNDTEKKSYKAPAKQPKARSYSNQKPKVYNDKPKSYKKKERVDLYKDVVNKKKSISGHLPQSILPNHIIHNEKIALALLRLLEAIPNKAVLNQVNLKMNSATLVCDVVNKRLYTKKIKPKILDIYQNSKIILSQKSGSSYRFIIQTTKLKHIYRRIKKLKPFYSDSRYISRDLFTKQIKAFLPTQNTVVKYLRTTKRKFKTERFSVRTIFESPQDLFAFIDELNSKVYSITLSYPVKLSQTKKGLEASFRLNFHQNKLIKPSDDVLKLVF